MMYASSNPSVSGGAGPVDSAVARRATDELSSSYTFVGTAGWRSPQLVALVKTASRFAADIRIRKDARTADGKSFLGLLTLGVKYGDKLTIHSIGNAASDALLAVAALPFFAPIT
jgi:phosphotransferase system HPr (HPr) family protein